MRQNSSGGRNLDDLLFELLEDHAGKFLIIISNSAKQRRKLLANIESKLNGQEKYSELVSVSRARLNLFESIIEKSKAGTVDAISLINFDQLDSKSLGVVLRELNFRRDALVSLGVPILIWLSESGLSQLTSAAPDLWSRRSAVYYFSQSSPKTLLRRLFSRVSSETKKWTPEPILSDAFEAIFSSERELEKCLVHRKSFSLTKTDKLIRNIRSGVDRLASECRKGRQIEIALWLWNLNHLDEELQQFLDSLQTHQKHRYESLYTDRNEALLYLSKKLPQILRNYLGGLDESIRRKKPIKLLDRSRHVALNRIKKMAQALSASERETLSLTSDFGESFASSDDEPGREAGENIFIQAAASDLEGWLAGITDLKSKYFTDEEGQLLRTLYQHSPPLSGIAQMLGIPEQRVQKKLSNLQRKVKAYLGSVTR